MSNRSCLPFALLSLVTAAAAFAQTSAPVAQPWAGWAQCQLSIQGPGYAHSETHLWTITGAGIQRANMEIYPTTWRVTGLGSLARDNGPTRVSAQWSGTGTLTNVEIGFTRHLDRITFQRWTGHGPAREAFVGAETRTTNGAGVTRVLRLDVQQWTFPAGQTGLTSTRITGSNTVPFNGARGPMGPTGANGTATCSWDFARGAESPSSPPPASLGNSPASGPVSGGAGTGSSGTGGGAGGFPTGGTSASNAYSLGSGFANQSTSPAGWLNANFAPTGAYTDQWWEFRAQDNPASTTASLQIRASISGAPSGHTYDIELHERTPSGVVARALSGTSQTPTAQMIWPNVPGSDDTRLFLIRVRQASGPASTGPVQMRVEIGGPIAGTTGGGTTGGGATSGSASADVSVTIAPLGTPRPASWQPDAMVAYAVEVRNNGPRTADGAVIQVPSSAQVEWTAINCTGTGGAVCSARGFIAPNELAAGFPILSLPAGGSMQLTFSAHVIPAASGSVTLSATVSAPAGVTDPNPANNSASMTQPITAAGTSGGVTASAGTVPVALVYTGLGVGCVMRGPDLGHPVSQPSYTLISWPALGGVTAYTVSRRDIGTVATLPGTPASGPSGSVNYEHGGWFDYRQTYVYTVVAQYGQTGCGVSTVSVTPRMPDTPNVTPTIGQVPGRVTLTWSMPGPSKFQRVTGVLVQGPFLPQAGRQGGETGSINIDGVPAGTHTWTLTAFWDVGAERKMEPSTGARVTVNVP